MLCYSAQESAALSLKRKMTKMKRQATTARINQGSGGEDRVQKGNLIWLCKRSGEKLSQQASLQKQALLPNLWHQKSHKDLSKHFPRHSPRHWAVRNSDSKRSTRREQIRQIPNPVRGLLLATSKDGTSSAKHAQLHAAHLMPVMRIQRVAKNVVAQSHYTGETSKIQGEMVVQQVAMDLRIPSKILLMMVATVKTTAVVNLIQTITLSALGLSMAEDTALGVDAEGEAVRLDCVKVSRWTESQKYKKQKRLSTRQKLKSLMIWIWIDYRSLWRKTI